MGCVFIFVWEKYTKTTLGPFQSTPYNIWWVKKKEGGYAPVPLSAVSVVVYLDEHVTLHNLDRTSIDRYCAAALCEHSVHTTL